MKYKVIIREERGDVELPFTDINNAMTVARAIGQDRNARENPFCDLWEDAIGRLVVVVEYYNEFAELWVYTDWQWRDEHARKEAIAAHENAVLAFNTGRAYTAKGQRVIAKRRGSWIAFRDLDRGIAGLIGWDPEIEMTQSCIMSAYDHDNYKSWVDDEDAYALLQEVERMCWDQVDPNCPV